MRARAPFTRLRTAAWIFIPRFFWRNRLQIPFFLQVHDDVAYTSAGRVPAKCMREAWQGASARFVISRELGDEYTKRYGEQEFVVVTDGLDNLCAKPRGPSKACEFISWVSSTSATKRISKP